jgi:hypothetical protein
LEQGMKLKIWQKKYKGLQQGAKLNFGPKLKVK